MVCFLNNTPFNFPSCISHCISPLSGGIFIQLAKLRVSCYHTGLYNRFSALWSAFRKSAFRKHFINKFKIRSHALVPIFPLFPILPCFIFTLSNRYIPVPAPCSRPCLFPRDSLFDNPYKTLKTSPGSAHVNVFISTMGLFVSFAASQ